VRRGRKAADLQQESRAAEGEGIVRLFVLLSRVHDAKQSEKEVKRSRSDLGLFYCVRREGPLSTQGCKG
jgi:hypothetical protein